ncbi:MAG: hypothetical protein ACLFRW_03900 [Halorhodospira sp.]
MGALLQTLLGICALREGPQDLPYSPRHLLGVIAASSALSVIAVNNLPETGPALPQVAVATLFSLAFLYALLILRGLQPRFVQSATALFGTDLIINLPVTALSFPIATHGPESAQGAVLAMLLLWFWQIAILGHILRHTLEMRLALGMLLAVGYTLLSVQVIQWAAD